MSLRVKLVRGMSRVGRERVLQDTPAIRGMIDKVSYLIEWSETQDEFKPFGRRARQKAQHAASAAKGAKAGTSKAKAGELR
jgi:hypothetical protein